MLRRYRHCFKSAGILVLFLPLYSPDLNPIEPTFSYLKQYLQEHEHIIHAVNNVTDIIKSAFASITVDYCGCQIVATLSS